MMDETGIVVNLPDDHISSVARMTAMNGRSNYGFKKNWRHYSLDNVFKVQSFEANQKVTKYKMGCGPERHSEAFLAFI